jgi:hypothetical protein
MRTERATVSVFLTVGFSPWVFEPTVNSSYELTVATTNTLELSGKSLDVMVNQMLCFQ